MNCKVSFISYSKHYKNKNEKKKGKRKEETGSSASHKIGTN